MFTKRNFVSNIKYVFGELHCLNKLALVGAFSLFSDAVQVKTGTIFLSRTSGADISGKVGALYLGQTLINITSYCIMQGITVGMCALCSQAHGANNHILVGTYFMRAMLISLLTCLPLWSFWISVRPLILYMTGDMELAEGAGHYTTMFCFGYPAFIYYKLANGFLQSQNIVYFLMFVMVAGNICNICLQYIFVVVIPLEITGVGLAYVISTNIVALFAYFYIKMTNVHILNFNGWSFEFLSGWLHMLKYGMASFAQILLDGIIFRIVPIVFIGFFLKDKEQFALLGILNIVWFVALTVPIGYGIGASVRIGNLLGAGNLQAARKTTVIAILYLLSFECCFGILTFSLSEPLSYLFTSIQEMRVQIEFGIRVLTFCILSDILTALRSILTVCSLHLYATFIQFVCVLLIGSPLGILVAFYVPWRAAAYYLMPSLFSIIAFFLQLLLLYFHDWRKILDKVESNVYSKDTSSTHQPTINKAFLLFRYLLLIFIGIALFATAYLYC
ncbi:Multidrug and toxin extrusion protein 1 [Oopsacas minuta]|uniref:Multidrug and toxin extrusion protein n=1 Tax=Oopsacas minuta TaxID=111878 RepID=A0AAV7KKT4_9METZ|nr:Multidrug and toxin extrusion protein 1 [Oopsacas minuta]